nr:hypothetical protein [Tanacetum cinerariifolium]
MDKLKLDEEVEEDEEEAAKEVIRNYKTLGENNNPGAFVLPIHRKREAKPIEIKIKKLDHSKAKPIGILRDVLCQVGVTIILSRFLILDISVDKDLTIVVGRRFLYTCGGIMNTIKGTNSTFNGTKGNNNDEVGSSRPKRTCEFKTVEEAMLPQEILNGLSALTYYTALDRITFRDLIGPNGRLITKAPMLGAPRVAMHVSPRPSM